MKTESYHVIGVMSGTSLDGIDLCEVSFELRNEIWDYKIIKAETHPYSNEWVEVLKNAHLRSRFEIDEINKSFTALLAKVIKSFIINTESIDLICSHGHTIWHQPENGITFQLGNLPELSKLIDKTVVCDFRTADVALGGQGAPLVPIGDDLLFSEFDYCINIGGFVNISYLFRNERIAFDICPANKVLNLLSSELGFDFDKNGEIAYKGKLVELLFDKLNAIPFYKLSPPKSLGTEWLEAELLPIIQKHNCSIDDKLHTFCHHVAYQIAMTVSPHKKVLITGGGAYNSFLIECIKLYSKTVNIHIPKPQIVEYKEAIIFGLLGVLKLRNEINVLSSVTGAKHDHSSGIIYRL